MSTKLASHLVDVYRQYKQDEKELLDWIKQTAKASVYGPETPQHQSPFERNVATKDAQGQQSNRNHQYVLDVLQDAVRLLKNKLPSDRRQGQENRTSCIDDEGLSLPNQFAKLGVIDSEAEEEASDLVLDLIASSPNTAYSRSVKAAFDLDDKTSREEEYMFMKICLLEEVEEIEAILILEWIGYTLDKKGLVRAALMTNAAVDIVRQQEESMRRHVDFLGWDEKFVSDCEEKFFSQLALTSNGNLEEPLMGMRKLLPETLASPFPKVACGDSGAKHPPQAVSYFDASADAVPTHNATTTQHNVATLRNNA